MSITIGNAPIYTDRARFWHRGYHHLILHCVGREFGYHDWNFVPDSGLQNRLWCCQLRWTLKLATAIGRQFITLSVHGCVQHGGRDAPRRAGLSAAVEIVLCWVLTLYFTVPTQVIGWKNVSDMTHFESSGSETLTQSISWFCLPSTVVQIKIKTEHLYGALSWV